MTGPDDAPARPGRSSLVLPGVTGFVGALGVTVGAALPGSPFTVQAAGAWFFADPTRPGVVDVGTRFAGIVLVYVGIAVLLASWYEVWCAVRVRPGSPTGPLVAILMAWELPVAVGLPLFSRDVYSYAAQGEMVTRGISPYTHGPDALGGGRFLSMVDPLWRHSPAPYGPAWERLSGWVVAASGHDVRGAVLGFRLLSLVGLVLIALAVPVLADAAGRDRSTAFALAVLNPLVVLVLVGGAHNDGLMLGLLLAGSALALRGHVVSGVVLCALGAEVKITALIGVVVIGWWAAGAGAGLVRRTAGTTVAVAGAAAVMAVVAAVSGLGWRVVSGLSNPGQVVSRLDPATGVGILLSHVAGALGAPGHATGFVDGARLGALVVAGVVSVALLVKGTGHGDRPAAALRILGAVLLVVALLGPVVWPWYETWGLVALAVVADGGVVVLVMALSVAGCVADVPRPGLLIDGTPAVVAATWALGALAVAAYVGTRRSRGPGGMPAGGSPAGGLSRRWRGARAPRSVGHRTGSTPSRCDATSAASGSRPR